MMTKMACLLLLLCANLPAISINNYQNQQIRPNPVTLEASQDSLLHLNLELFFRDYYKYGLLTEDRRNISSLYKSLYRSMFAPNAMIYDFLITNELLDVDRYINTLINRYPQGISFLEINIHKVEVYDYDEQSYLASVDVEVEKTVHETSDDIRGRQHAEDLVFNILLNRDMNMNSFLIESIRKPFFHPIPEVNIRIINLNAPTKKMEGLEFLLMADGEIIQSQKSNSEGIVRFLAVPSDKQTHVRLAEDTSYDQYETLILDPQSASFQETASIFIRPRVEDVVVTAAHVEKPTWLIGINIAPTINSFNLGEYRLTGNYNMPNERSVQLGSIIGFDARYRKYISDHSFSLDFGLGLQIHTFGYSYKSDNILQTTPAGNTYSFNDFEHIGNFRFLHIPISVYLRQEKAWSAFDARYAYFRLNLSNAIGKSFEQTAKDDSETWELKRDNNITGIKPSLEFGLGLEINTRIPELVFSASIGGAVYRGDMINIASPKNEIDRIMDHPIFHYSKNSRLFHWGPSFSLTYPLSSLLLIF